VGIVGDVSIIVHARGVNAEDLHLRALADPTGLVDAGRPEYRRCKPDRDILDRRGATDGCEHALAPRRSRRHDVRRVTLPGRARAIGLDRPDAIDAELDVMLPAADLAASRFDRAEAIIEHD
jgi:hypothetical protein